MGKEPGQFNMVMNSNEFMYGLLAGYVCFLLGAAFEFYAMFYGSGICIMVSLGWYFFGFINALNLLNGAISIDTVIYRAGEKPSSHTFHIGVPHILHIQTDDLNITKEGRFIEEYDKEYHKLMSRIEKYVEILPDYKNLTPEQKEERTKKLKEEVSNFDGTQKYYAYRCEMIRGNKYTMSNNQKHNKYTQFVIITDFPFNLQFPTHQGRTFFNRKLVNTSLTYTDFLLVGITGADMPVFYSMFSGHDAEEHVKQTINAKSIPNALLKIADSLYFSQQLRYMHVDKYIEKLKQQNKDLRRERDEVIQYNMMYRRKKIKTGKDELTSKIQVSKRGMTMLIIALVVLLVFVAILISVFSESIFTTPTINAPTNSTTTLQILPNLFKVNFWKRVILYHA